MHVLWVLIYGQLVLTANGANVVIRPQIYGAYSSERECERFEGVAKVFGHAAHDTTKCVKLVKVAPTRWIVAK